MSNKLLVIVLIVALALTACTTPIGDLPPIGVSSTPTATSTPNVNVAINATMTAQAPTQPPVDYNATVQAGVDATQAALPTNTATSTPTNTPAATATAIPATATATSMPKATAVISECKFDTPSANLDGMPKTLIDLAPLNTWFHRVYDPRAFHAPDWGGADSWAWSTLALGPNNGGSWISFGNPGEFQYRATENTVNWCLGIKTTAQYKSQALGNQANLPMSVNIRIAPYVTLYVRAADGSLKSGETSDLGDIQVVLPDEGVVYIWTEFTTAAPTGESLVWFGPRDRTQNINTVDAR